MPEPKTKRLPAAVMHWLRRLIAGPPCKNGVYGCWDRCVWCIRERIAEERKEKLDA